MLEITSLREQVYQYLRSEMQTGKLLPGTSINLREISQKLGISTTPLRDAVIQLECEGFVTILPRRGIVVNKLTLQDIKNSLEIVGALEAAVVVAVFERIGPDHIERMRQLNNQLRRAIQTRRFEEYYRLNLAFHDVFVDLSENKALKSMILPMKQRLYDFPFRSYIIEWELINCEEHDQFTEHLLNGEPEAAALLWKTSHWSFSAHEKYIRQFYSESTELIEAQLNNGVT